LICDNCSHYAYDDYTDEYYCTVNMDEDEVYRFCESGASECPFYDPYDEYKIVHKQN
jgi:hypothetical protein